MCTPCQISRKTDDHQVRFRFQRGTFNFQLYVQRKQDHVWHFTCIFGLFLSSNTLITLIKYTCYFSSKYQSAIESLQNRLTVYTMVGEEAGIMEYVHLRGVEIIHQIQHTFKVNKYLLYQERIYTSWLYIQTYDSSPALRFISSVFI